MLYGIGIMNSTAIDSTGRAFMITPAVVDSTTSIPVKVEHSGSNVGYVNVINVSDRDVDIYNVKDKNYFVYTAFTINDQITIDKVQKGQLGFLSANWKPLQTWYNPTLKLAMDTEAQIVELSLTSNPSNRDCKWIVVTKSELEDYYATSTKQLARVKNKSTFDILNERIKNVSMSNDQSSSQTTTPVPEPEVVTTTPVPEPEVVTTTPVPEPEVVTTTPVPEPEVVTTTPVPEPVVDTKDPYIQFLYSL